MRIRAQRPLGEDERSSDQVDLTRLIEESAVERRPCSDCKEPCACSRRSTICSCRCSADCPLAPEKLSFDPEGYPLEPGVVPLVFELAKLRLLPTCWSCEGHDDGSGGIKKIPQVWFHSRSSTYPELLSSHLVQLQFRGILRFRWIVTVLGRTDEQSPKRYAVRPDLSLQRDKVELAELREDLLAIADGLQETLVERARKRLAVHAERIRSAERRRPGHPPPAGRASGGRSPSRARSGPSPGGRCRAPRSSPGRRPRRAPPSARPHRRAA